MRPIDLFYRALNVPMRALLRSSLHGMMSGNLGLLTYRGRRSGKTFTTPLSYVLDASGTQETVRLLSSHKTRWWKNFLDGGADVMFEIAGTTRQGRAITILEDGDRFRDGVRSFLTALPRDAVVYGIGLDADKRPVEADIEGAAGHVVLVEIPLED